jgi:tryptophan-rich sensory protein
MRLFLFLIINFGALTLGALLMGDNPGENIWYQNLNKAPWTPPGWVFGFAWTLIMICYSVYMSTILVNFKEKQLSSLWTLFGIQWVLNVIWNLFFFNLKMPLLALFILVLLILTLCFLHLNYSDNRKVLLLYLAPYLLWLLVAFSLNFYVILYN